MQLKLILTEDEVQEILLTYVNQQFHGCLQLNEMHVKEFSSEAWLTLELSEVPESVDPPTGKPPIIFQHSQ